MMRFLALLVTGFLVAVSGTSSAQERGETTERSLWIYEGGWFQKLDGMKWFEVNSGVYDGGKGKFEYREVNRTAKYVELYDESRKVSGRLYDDHHEDRVDGVTEWRQIYKGRWKK